MHDIKIKDSGLRPIIELREVSLRFLRYHDKAFSLKRAALNWLTRRSAPPAFEAFWALRDVDLTVEDGTRLGIVGSNGAGKSTLLRVIARIYKPTTGACFIRGSVAPLIEMGAGFNPELTGRENILLYGALLGIPRTVMRERIDAILEFTELGEFAGTALKYYSSGMYAKLAFAVATEVAPDVLLIDESLSVGDAEFVAKAYERIRQLMARCRAVIVVSHDLQSLHDLCDRAIWIDHGRVLADGPVDEILDRYRGRCPGRTAEPPQLGIAG